MEKYYVTTAIDYPNAAPHIGHALEKVQADAIARYNRLHGSEVFYLTGTDEHGAKVARTAEDAGVEVEEFVDKNVESFKKLIEALNISNDYFIRTTNKELHWPAVNKIWKTLEESGDIYKKQYEGLYCYGHEAFVTRKDLNKKGECEIHEKEPEEVKEENYFFRLSKYAGDVHKRISEGKLQILPAERKNEVLRFLEGNVEDISFSRPSKDLKWGVPVPGDDTQTVYVWADALTNYISALGWGVEDNSRFKKFWPADVHVIGKDILRFHAVYWPAMLLSAGVPLPKKLFVHGFISVDGRKMSKSLGNIIDPIEMVKKYGADAARWYLLAEIPSTRDGDFSFEKFEARYNGDLASGLGNLTSRLVALGAKNAPENLKSSLIPDSEKEIDKRWKNYKRLMEEFSFADSIREAQALISHADKRINEIKLWELPGSDDKKFEKEIASLTTVLANIALMLYPVIPDSCEQIFSAIGADLSKKGSWKFNFKKGEAIFPRL